MKTLKTMKLTRFFAIVALMVLAGQSLNANIPPANQQQRLYNVQQILDKAVDFPQQAREQGVTGTVKAEIEVNAAGQLVISAINGHPVLTRYVKTQLGSVTFSDYHMIGERFIANFDFRN